MKLVNLGRYGDLINLFPLLQHLSKQDKIEVVVNRDFVSLFDGISYATPIVSDCQPENVKTVMEKYPEAIQSQVFRNPRTEALSSKSFALMQWELVGPQYLDLYYQLPLIFDKRDAQREEKLLNSIPIDPNKKTIVYNFASYSSPFPHYAVVYEVLKIFDCNLIDLNHYRCERIYDQIAVLDRADVVVTVDTATLHLVNAVKKPTLAFSYADEFLGSPQRDWWLSRQTYNGFSLADIHKQIEAVIGK